MSETILNSLYVASDNKAKSILWKLPADGSPAEKLAENCLGSPRATPEGRYLVGRCIVTSERSDGVCAYSLLQKECLQVLPGDIRGIRPTADGATLIYLGSRGAEMTFHRIRWKDGKKVGEPQVALHVPFSFPTSLGYFGSAFDYTPDLSTVVYARPAGQADLYFLSTKD